MVLVSLPWYDLEAIRPATDELWRLLARNLRKRGFSGVPDTLNRQIPHQVQWTSEKLLFSQACGYDVLLAHHNHLRIVATPVYRAVGCLGPYYSSFIVVREDSPVRQVEELRGLRAVVNSLTSHSGMNALRALVAPLHQNGRFFSNVCVSNSHEASLGMISEGVVDVAAIDCVTYGLLKLHRPDSLSGIRVVCCSEHMPAPPYVVGAAMSDEKVEDIRTALLETLEEPANQSLKEALLLDSVQQLPLAKYQPIANWESEASHCGYTEMACYADRFL